MNRIRSLREERRMTQSELGKLLNVKDAAISKYESEKVPLTADTLIRLSDIFSVSTDYLLGISNTIVSDNKVSLNTDAFLSERLKFLILEDSNLSEEYYSSVTKIPIGTLIQYTTGKSNPTAYDICKIVEVFDTTADFLFGKSNLPHPEKTHHFLSEGDLPSNLLKEMDGNLLETELAEKLNVSISTIKSYLSGESSPEAPQLYQIAQILQRSTDYLLGITKSSRPKSMYGYYPFVFEENVAKRISNLMDLYDESITTWSDLLSITEDEVYLLKKYGFIVHISILSKLSELLNVSIDYLSGKTDATKILEASEEALLLTYRNLNEENQSIAYGEMLKIKKEQEREEFIRNTSPVAADNESHRTGTDSQGKSLPSNGTGGSTKVG